MHRQRDKPMTDRELFLALALSILIIAAMAAIYIWMA